MTRPRGGTIVIGTFNPGKAEEMVTLLRDCHLPVRGLAEYPDVTPVPEDGQTFAENARDKAMGLARQLSGDELFGVVADDSGLEVDALDRRPGVFSARYLGEEATDPERVQGILRELGDLPPEQRTARFRCAVCLADGRDVFCETEGAVEGRIGFAAAGTFGFGYDPIFIPRGHDRTFAELGADVKHEISHRARAIAAFREALLRLVHQDSEAG